MSKVFGTIVNPKGDTVGYGLYELYETHRGNVRLKSGTTSFPISWLKLNTDHSNNQEKRRRGEFERKDNSD